MCRLWGFSSLSHYSQKSKNVSASPVCQKATRKSRKRTAQPPVHVHSEVSIFRNQWNGFVAACRGNGRKMWLDRGVSGPKLGTRGYYPCMEERRQFRRHFEYFGLGEDLFLGSCLAMPYRHTSVGVSRTTLWNAKTYFPKSTFWKVESN